MRRIAAAAALAVLTAVAAAPLPAPAEPTAAPAPAAGQQLAAAVGSTHPTVRLTHQGRTILVRLEPFGLRAPSFQLLIQRSDGRYAELRTPGNRAFVGTVRGDPFATASAIRKADGTLAGQVSFGAGGTWYFDDGEVTGDRGLALPEAYAFPSADNAALNRTVAPGQVGPTTYRWDVAFDVDASWFFDERSGNASVAETLDAVELLTVSLVPSYLVGAKLRPALSRVVIRGSVAASPYTGAINGSGGQALGAVRNEWRDRQGPQLWDNVALLYVPGPDGSGGGNAFVNSAGTDNGASRNAGRGLQRAIVRHEIGHNWNVLDNHTNGPEGRTIMSGNQYDRFDGTELSAILRYRDRRQADSAPFTPFPPTRQALPPYAALDLIPATLSGHTVALGVTANDHDANGGPLSAPRVNARSRLGGTLTVQGTSVLYTPPYVTRDGVVDHFRYAVSDRTGLSAIGNVVIRVNRAPTLLVPRAAAPGESINTLGRTNPRASVELLARVVGEREFSVAGTAVADDVGLYVVPFRIADRSELIARSLGRVSPVRVVGVAP